jgi:hypothetical protein
MLKKCRRCKRELPLSAFHLDRRGGGKYGRQGRCRPCMKVGMAEYHLATRLRVLAHYSGGSMRCACCGENEVEFLSIDHIHRDGAQHRREVRPSAIYRWLIKHQFPPGIQVLCHNCNLANGYYGACPHQDDGAGEGAQFWSYKGGPIAAPETLLGQACNPGEMPTNWSQDAKQVVHQTGRGADSPAIPSSTGSDRRNAAAVALSKLGASKGGRARAAALSAAERRAIAKKAVAARWARKQ